MIVHNTVMYFSFFFFKGQTRDWNEELQTTRELPRKNLPERLLRERAVFKVHSDFVSAATRGAIAVIDGNVMAINPGEDPKMQMFIWNNIFFSLGFDVRDHYKDLGGDAAAFVAPRNDLQGVKVYNAVDLEGICILISIEMCLFTIPYVNIIVLLSQKANSFETPA